MRRWIGLLLAAGLAAPRISQADQGRRQDQPSGRPWLIAEGTGGTEAVQDDAAASDEETRSEKLEQPAGRGASRKLREEPGPATDIDEQEGRSGEEIQRLKRLRQENPEEFARVIKDKKAQLRRRLAQLRHKDPPAYEELVEKLQNRRQRRLERLKELDPELYRQALQRRRQWAERRLNELKQTDPQRYEQLMQRRQQWRREALEQLKQRDPDGYQHFLRTHPRWAEQVEDHNGGASTDRGAEPARANPNVEGVEGRRQPFKRRDPSRDGWNGNDSPRGHRPDRFDHRGRSNDGGARPWRRRAGSGLPGGGSDGHPSR